MYSNEKRKKKEKKNKMYMLKNFKYKGWELEKCNISNY